MHPDQLEIRRDQVAALVADELPHLAGRPVTPVAGAGTVNAIFRIGDDVSARFPLRPGDPAAVRHELEQDAARAGEFGSVTTVPAPRALHVGRLGHGYPLPWSAQTWLPGEVATPTSAAGSTGLALDLARLIGSLRAAPTRGRRFDGSGRGGQIADHDEVVAGYLERSAGLVDVEGLRRLWASYRTLPHPDADVMSHTDLIPGNLLLRDGRLAGVLDTGGFGPADPALDLVCAWHLLGPDSRPALRAALGCSDLQWERGKAWALQQAAGAVWYYRETNPAMAEMGRTTLERLLADD